MRSHSESELQYSANKYLQDLGWLVFRINSGRWQNQASGSWIIGAPDGTADTIVGIPTPEGYKIGFIEYKSSVGSLRASQVAFMRYVHSKGCPWLVCNEFSDIRLWEKSLAYHGKEKYTKIVLGDAFVAPWSGKHATAKSKASFATMVQLMAHDKFKNIPSDVLGDSIDSIDPVADNNEIPF